MVNSVGEWARNIAIGVAVLCAARATPWLLFHLVLRPLILRDYRLRKERKRPDRWYWADKLAVRMGYYV